MAFGNMEKIGVLVNLIIQKLNGKRLVCLSFWSGDPGFKIFILTHKLWAIMLNREVGHEKLHPV